MKVSVLQIILIFQNMSQVAYILLIDEKQKLFLMEVLSFTMISYVFVFFKRQLAVEPAFKLF